MNEAAIQELIDLALVKRDAAKRVIRTRMMLTEMLTRGLLQPREPMADRLRVVIVKERTRWSAARGLLAELPAEMGV